VTTLTAGQVAARRWKASRGIAIFLLVLAVLAIVLAALRPQVGADYLDPESPDKDGTRALVQLLGQNGVHVTVVQDAQEAVAQSGPGSLLVVVRPERLTAGQVSDLLAGTGDLLLVEPTRAALNTLAPQIAQGPAAVDPVAAPGCALPAATAAGKVDFGASGTFDAAASSVACYPAEGHPRLVQVQAGARTITVLGSGSPLTNGSLTQEGNAALGMSLAGGRPNVVWLMPGLPPAGGTADKTFWDLVPSGVKLALLQVIIAVLLVAFWRLRRLGPVVAESLPVVIRSAEAVEGRARLYRGRRARDRAADALRSGALERLVPRLGMVRADATQQEIVLAVGARVLLGQETIHWALYGPEPDNDVELVRLTDILDDLERQVRQS
jgi:hypothetical protein